MELRIYQEFETNSIIFKDLETQEKVEIDRTVLCLSFSPTMEQIRAMKELRDKVDRHNQWLRCPWLEFI